MTTTRDKALEYLKSANSTPAHALSPGAGTNISSQDRARDYLKGMQAGQSLPIPAPPQVPAPQTTQTTRQTPAQVPPQTPANYVPIPAPVTPDRPGLLSEMHQGLVSAIDRWRANKKAERALRYKAFGLEEASQHEIEELQKMVQNPVARPRIVDKVEDIHSVEDFAYFAARTLGETVPDMAAVIAGGGAGATASKVTTKLALKKGLAAKLNLKAAQIDNLVKKSTKAGGVVGSVGTAAYLETMATATEQAVELNEVYPAQAVVAGLLKGSLEAVVPMEIMSRFGLTPKFTMGLTQGIKSKAKEILANMGKTATLEAVTESLQEAIDVYARNYVDENYDMLGADARSRILNAAASGGIVGVVLGPLGGGGRRISIDDEAAQEQQDEVNSVPEGEPLDPDIEDVIFATEAPPPDIDPTLNPNIDPFEEVNDPFGMTPLKQTGKGTPPVVVDVEVKEELTDDLISEYGTLDVLRTALHPPVVDIPKRLPYIPEKREDIQRKLEEAFEKEQEKDKTSEPLESISIVRSDEDFPKSLVKGQEHVEKTLGISTKTSKRNRKLQKEYRENKFPGFVNSNPIVKAYDQVIGNLQDAEYKEYTPDQLLLPKEIAIPAADLDTLLAPAANNLTSYRGMSSIIDLDIGEYRWANIPQSTSYVPTVVRSFAYNRTSTAGILSDFATIIEIRHKRGQPIIPRNIGESEILIPKMQFRVLQRLDNVIFTDNKLSRYYILERIDYAYPTPLQLIQRYQTELAYLEDLMFNQPPVRDQSDVSRSMQIRERIVYIYKEILPQIYKRLENETDKATLVDQVNSELFQTAYRYFMQSENARHARQLALDVRPQTAEEGLANSIRFRQAEFQIKTIADEANSVLRQGVRETIASLVNNIPDDNAFGDWHSAEALTRTNFAFQLSDTLRERAREFLIKQWKGVPGISDENAVLESTGLQKLLNEYLTELKKLSEHRNWNSYSPAMRNTGQLFSSSRSYNSPDMMRNLGTRLKKMIEKFEYVAKVLENWQYYYSTQGQILHKDIPYDIHDTIKEIENDVLRSGVEPGITNDNIETDLQKHIEDLQLNPIVVPSTVGPIQDLVKQQDHQLLEILKKFKEEDSERLNPITTDDIDNPKITTLYSKVIPANKGLAVSYPEQENIDQTDVDYINPYQTNTTEAAEYIEEVQNTGINTSGRSLVPFVERDLDRELDRDSDKELRHEAANILILSNNVTILTDPVPQVDAPSKHGLTEVDIKALRGAEMKIYYLADKLIDLFAFPHELKIHFRYDTTVPNLGAMTWRRKAGKDYGTIELETSNLRRLYRKGATEPIPLEDKIDEMYKVFVHEFEHYTVYSYWLQASKPLRDLVSHKYLEEKAKAINDWEYALMNFFSPFRSLAMIRYAQDENGVFDIAKLKQYLRDNEEYFMSKHEWLAEQGVRATFGFIKFKGHYSLSAIASLEHTFFRSMGIRQKKVLYELMTALGKTTNLDHRTKTYQGSLRPFGATAEFYRFRKFAENLPEDQYKTGLLPSVLNDVFGNQGIDKDPAKDFRLLQRRWWISRGLTEMPIVLYSKVPEKGEGEKDTSILSRPMRAHLSYMQDFMKSFYLNGMQYETRPDTIASYKKSKYFKQALEELRNQRFNDPRKYFPSHKAMTQYFRATDQNTRQNIRDMYGIPGPVAVTVDGAPLYKGSHKIPTKDMLVIYQLVRYLNTSMQQLQITAPLKVSFEEGLEVPVKLIQNSTTMDLKINLGIISLDDYSSVYLGVISEFGDFVRLKYLERLDYGTLDVLQQIYNEERLKAEKSYNYFLAYFSSPENAYLLEQQRRDKDMDFTAYRNFLKLDQPYWLGFDQWFKNQFSRSQYHLETRLGSDMTFLKPLIGLRKRLTTILKKVLTPSQRYRLRNKLPPDESKPGDIIPQMSDWRAHPEYAEWLKEMRWGERLDKKAGKALQELYETALYRGAAKAAEVLEKNNIEKLMQDEFVPPEDRTVEGEKHAMKNLGIPEKEATELTYPRAKFNWFMDIFLSLQQITRENPELAPLQKYTELVDQWYIFQTNWYERADKTLKVWGKLSYKQQENLSKLLLALDNLEHMMLGSGDLLPRHPTDKELAELAQKYGVNEHGLDVYFQINKDFRAVLEYTKEIEIQRIENSGQADVVKAQGFAEIHERYDTLLSRPYFPHARFGKFAVEVRSLDNEILYLEHFEKHRQAKRALDRISKKYKNIKGTKTKVRKVPIHIRSLQGLPHAALEAIRERLHEKLSPEDSDWFDDYIKELDLQVGGSPKDLAGRLNVKGFTSDTRRAYAMYFFNNAKSFARLKYGNRMERAIQQMNSLSISLPDGIDASKHDRIHQMMRQHFHFIMNSFDDWAQLRSLAFHWMLGFNVSSAALNLTQVPLVAYPYMAARFGDARTSAELIKAGASVMSNYKGKPGNIPDDLADALKIAVREGVVDESQASELAGVAQGVHLTGALPHYLQRTSIPKISFLSSVLFQTTEKLNRRGVFRAGWHLYHKTKTEKKTKDYVQELQKAHMLEFRHLTAMGMTRDQINAYLVAKDVTRRTQYQYAEHSRAKFMRGKKGVLFVFYQFLQQTLYFASREPGAWRFWLMLLFFAGLMGLPGAEDINDIVKKLGQMIFGKNYNPEKELRKAITEFTEDEIPADIILHGLSRYSGLPKVAEDLGIPAPQFDFSGRLSLGRVVPGIEALSKSGTGFNTAFTRASTDIAGAVFGTGVDIGRSWKDSRLPASDLKRWERAMPKSLANISRAYRYGTEGKERTSTGASVVEFDMKNPTHVLEVAGRGLGFVPTRISKRWDREAFIRETEKFWATQRNILMTRFDQAISQDDDEMREQVIKDIVKYNKEIPYKGAAISVKNIKASRKKRLLERRRFEAGVGMSRSFTPLKREADRLYGTVEDVK